MPVLKFFLGNNFRGGGIVVRFGVHHPTTAAEESIYSDVSCFILYFLKLIFIIVIILIQFKGRY